MPKIITELVNTEEKNQVWSGRIRELGLTAYGYDQEKAIKNCKHMFQEFLKTYAQKRKLHLLTDRLLDDVQTKPETYTLRDGTVHELSSRRNCRKWFD